MDKRLVAAWVAVASLLTAGAAVNTAVFVTKYGYLLGYEDSLEALRAQEEELAVLLAEEEAALGEVEAANEVMTAAKEENTWDKQIRQAFVEGEKARAESDILTLSVLEQINIITYGTEDFNETMKAALLDEVIGAASDKIPLDSIITGATEGISEGLYGYAEGKAKDYLADLLGGDIFEIKDMVDQLADANDVPAVLANQMAEKQRSRAAGLMEFMERDERSVQDQRRAADSLYQLMDMEEQAAAAAGGAAALQKSHIYSQMVEYARQYGISQYAIRQISQWKEDTDEK